jgi:hypothetical protein
MCITRIVYVVAGFDASKRGLLLLDWVGDKVPETDGVMVATPINVCCYCWRLVGETMSPKQGR